jgi:hypothetical protein
MDEHDCRLSPSANGILQCLKALAQEAASLHLFRTLSAIEDALEAAARESGLDALAVETGGSPARVLH